MKRLFPITLLLVILTLFGCSQEYNITGTIEGAIDGDSVTLGYSADGVDFTITDKTVIENGEFHFNGKINGSKIYYIGYEQGIEPMYLLFFLEEGDINIKMAANDGLVTGTPSNDLNTLVEENIMACVNRMLEAEFMLQPDSLANDSTVASKHLEISELRQNAMQYIKDIVTENKNSIVSLYLIVQYSAIFSIEELDEYVNNMPSEFIDRKNNCLYDILMEMINDRKNNNRIILQEPVFE